MKPITVFIYGLFQGNRCVYVGQSTSPDERFQSHTFYEGKSRRNGLPTEMKILATCNSANAEQFEREFIVGYRAIAQAEWNIVLPKGSPRKRRVLMELQSGRKWESYRELYVTGWASGRALTHARLSEMRQRGELVWVARE